MNQRSAVKEAKEEVFLSLSGIAQAMGAPARLKIIQVLSNQPSNVEGLSERIGESVANTSQHLQKLKTAGIVHVEKIGVSRAYTLANKEMVDLWLNFQDLAGKLSSQMQIDEEVLCPEGLRTPLSLEQILRDVKNGKAILIDVRDEIEFQTTPAPLAIFFPRNELAKNLKLLAKKKIIYAFCRGRYCILANEVVQELRKRGYEAYRLRQMSHEIEQAHTAREA